MTTPKRKRPHPTPAEREREAVILRMRLAGATSAQIGERLHISDSNVRHIWARAAQRATAEPAQELIDLECARLDAIWHTLWERAMEGELPVIATLLRVSEQRRSLLGLDRPARQEVRLEHADALTAELDRIAAVIAARASQEGGVAGDGSPGATAATG
jgi:DNA-binding CsgD family transcriptional regulator